MTSMRISLLSATLLGDPPQTESYSILFCPAMRLLRPLSVHHAEKEDPDSVQRWGVYMCGSEYPEAWNEDVRRRGFDI
jgi:hypothetical protein